MASGGPPRAGHVAGRIAVGYAMLASLSTALALALREGVPWVDPSPWMLLEPRLAMGASAVLGLATALLIIAATRFTVPRFRWAQRLHMELRPIAHGLTLPQVALIAGFSSLGEELLFRGLLQPWLGLPITALLFGLAHQAPGPARWVWVSWATIVGLIFGAVFRLTGSLVGPLLAHALINAVNLIYLRDFDPTRVAQSAAGMGTS